MKKTKIAEPPEILNLSIQRYKEGQNKNECLIQFPQVLDISEFIDNDLEYNGETLYFLYGIINHEGNSTEFGHYYSNIRINDIWYKFNDRDVSRIQSLDYSSSNAYSLFYLKIYPQ